MSYMIYDGVSREGDVRDKSLPIRSPPRRERGERDKMDSGYRKPQTPSFELGPMAPRENRVLSVDGRLNLPILTELLAASRRDSNIRQLLLSRPSPASQTYRSSTFSSIFSIFSSSLAYLPISNDLGRYVE